VGGREMAGGLIARPARSGGLHGHIGDRWRRRLELQHARRELDIISPPTMLAQFGYFLDSLFFPVKLVLEGLGGRCSP